VYKLQLIFLFLWHLLALFRKQPLRPACFFIFIQINDDDNDDDDDYEVATAVTAERVYLMCLEAGPLERRLFGIVVVVGGPQVLLRLTQEALGLRRLRVDAAECRRHVEVVVGPTGAVFAREVLLAAD